MASKTDMMKLGGAVVAGLAVGAIGVFAYKKLTTPAAGQVFINSPNARFPFGVAVGVLPGAGQVFSNQPFAPVGLAFASAPHHSTPHRIVR